MRITKWLEERRNESWKTREEVAKIDAIGMIRWRVGTRVEGIGRQ